MQFERYKIVINGQNGVLQRNSLCKGQHHTVHYIKQSPLHDHFAFFSPFTLNTISLSSFKFCNKMRRCIFWAGTRRQVYSSLCSFSCCNTVTKSPNELLCQGTAKFPDRSLDIFCLVLTVNQVRVTKNQFKYKEKIYLYHFFDIRQVLNYERS